MACVRYFKKKDVFTPIEEPTAWFYLASLCLHYIPQWDQFTCMILTSKNLETTQPYSLLGAPIIAWFYTYSVWLYVLWKQTLPERSPEN